MSWDNALGILNEGLWNEIGDDYLRFESMGFLGVVNNEPPPTPGGSTGFGADGGMSGVMSPLGYWKRTRRLKDDNDQGRDAQRGRQGRAMEAVGLDGEKERARR